ncbi:AhpC/TSA family protein [Acidicapsa dinghuensis]|uniref:AhpC/TSA family protein n=1 Tax=Acidicapsa dinghuensis TaxID=2218256 RepID=A0ABW1EJY8_9BACT|nr:AhpC/TSA family protein [Acidicapsa dinghuensis]
MKDQDEQDLAEALRSHRTESERTLLELVDESPVLLVFLRHFGCAFCAMALDQVSQIQEQLAAKSIRPVFVHLGTPERARPYFKYYKLDSVERISNPDASLYQHSAFALRKTNPYLQPFNLAVLRGWFKGALFKYGINPIFKEDAYQMPGVFFLKDRKIVRAFRHKDVSDEPNYLKLAGIR